jgi:hypothetical protein
MRRVGEHSHRRWGAIGGLWGVGTNADVIVPPPGELFSETNDNSVAILLTYSTTRDLLAGDAKAREEYVAGLPSVHTWRSRAARRDRWRHPRVLEAANLPSIFDPNRPQQSPTQTDTPRRAFHANPGPEGHYPTSIRLTGRPEPTICLES